MELYILDRTFRPLEIVDTFKSFIWTERFSAFGDFELVISSTVESRSLFTIGVQLGIPNSYRVMTVETIDSKDGVLTIKGRSLEAVLEDRVAKRLMSTLAAEEKWVLTGTPGNIVRTIFQTVCVDGALNAGDVIPFITAGSIFPPDTIVEPSDVVTVELTVKSLYDTIKELCDIYILGFRLVRGLSESQLYFNVYSGSDRTTNQSAVSAVVFSPSLDNLANVAELTSSEKYKNVAYVFSKNGFEIVYASPSDALLTGFQRRVLVVNPTGIDDALLGAGLTYALQQAGQDELSKNKNVSAFDGELPPTSGYIYGIDYELGDLLEMQNSNGATNYMRVTEQIFVADAEGERSYPTLAIDLINTPASWYDWNYNDVWDDVDAFWEDV